MFVIFGKKLKAMNLNKFLFIIFLFFLMSCSSDSSTEEPEIMEDDSPIALNCNAEINLEIDSVANTKFDINWTSTGDYSSFEIEYGTEGFIIGEGSSVSSIQNQLSIEELMVNTTYEVYIRGICDSEAREWSAPLSVTTSCDLGLFQGNVVLNSQEDVDAFGNSCYTGVEGTLIIKSSDPGTSITDLSALANISEISRGLIIEENPDLENLDGLNNLDSVGVIYINRNRVLTSISALNKIQTITGSVDLEDYPPISGLRITTNIALSSLDGLDNLETVSDLGLSSIPITSLSPLSKLSIVLNDMEISFTELTTLEGLASIEEVQNIVIQFNSDLESLEGLESLSTVKDLFYIWKNDNLTSLAGLNSLKSVERFVIQESESLLSVEEIGDLEQIRVLSLKQLPILESLTGVNLSQIGSFLEIIECDSLSNFQGVIVESQNDLFIQVTNCTNLVSFIGLEGINEMEGLLITENENLASLSGLENLILTRNYIDIRNNFNLRDFCALTNLFQNGEVQGGFSSSNNGVDFTPEEIASGFCD